MHVCNMAQIRKMVKVCNMGLSQQSMPNAMQPKHANVQCAKHARCNAMQPNMQAKLMIQEHANMI